MKKIIYVLLVVMMMAFSSVCSASDSSDLNGEQKTIQLFLTTFKGEEVPEYSELSRDFSDGLKNEFTQAKYNGLQRNVKNNFGLLTEAKFFAYQRYDQNDIIVYYLAFDSNKVAQMVFTFDKNQKLVNIAMTEVNTQQQSK